MRSFISKAGSVALGFLAIVGAYSLFMALRPAQEAYATLDSTVSSILNGLGEGSWGLSNTTALKNAFSAAQDRADGQIAAISFVSSVTCGAGLSGGTFTGTGTCSMPSTGTAASYSGVTTDAQGRVTAGTSRSFSYPTRSLNTCFQVSSTRDAQVTYAVDIQTNITLTTGQQGTVYLRTYNNSGCTTGTQELQRFVNGQTGTLTIGLALTQNVTAALSGIIPGGAFVQLVTENNTGTPTFTARPGEEVLL